MENRVGFKTSFSMLALAATLISGCGRENTVYSNANGLGADSITIRDGRSLLPQGFLDQSTGDGRIEVVNPGTSQSRVRLTGTRAILGLTNYDGLSLADFTLEIKTETATPLTLALLIDRDCQSRDLETLIASDEGELRATIENVLAVSPNACLRNGVSERDDLPSFPIGSVLLMNGAPDSAASDSIELQTLKIHSDTFTTWGAQ